MINRLRLCGKFSDRIFSDYRNAINKNGIIHIANRHGLNGEHDSSMQNTGDIARAGYVIENFDSVERVFNGDGSPAYSTWSSVIK